MLRPVKREQMMRVFVPQNTGTLRCVIADHWKNKGHKFTTINFEYPLAFINCVGVVLFKKYCLRNTVIPQASKTDIHIQTCTHVYQLIYLLYFVNLKYWRLSGLPSGPQLFNS